MLEGRERQPIERVHCKDGLPDINVTHGGQDVHLSLKDCGSSGLQLDVIKAWGGLDCGCLAERKTTRNLQELDHEQL